MKIIIFFVLLFFAKISLANQLIRVHILDASQVNISCTGFFYAMVDSDGTVLEYLRNNVVVERHENFIKVGNLGYFYGPIIFQPVANNQTNNFITVNTKPYMGKIEVSLANGRVLLSIINEVNVEDYLLGVIMYEMSPKWSFEALKAQVVIARTFVLSRKHHRDYNVCSKVHCQVYRGVVSEDERIRRAVKETAGEVLFYKDRVADVAYFSTCGGKILSAEIVWGVDISYLRNRSCHFCKNSHHFKEWTYTITYKDLEVILQRAGIISSQLLYIRRNDPFIKITLCYIKNNNSYTKVDVPISRLRFAIGPDKIKSSNFIIKNRGGNIIFEGRGAGHNVGLCQWGANDMADHGYNYKEILNYYFPECDIRPLDIR